MTAPSAEPAWYCLRAAPKHEHIAAAALAQQAGVQSFCPRIRYRKATRRGPVWFTEAMFPGYLFARFPYPEMHRAIRYANGVAAIVQFGAVIPILHDEVIGLLRAAGEAGGDLVVLDQALQPGDEVVIAAGAFRGFEAVVHRVLPARDRLKVLLEMLGRTVEAEVTPDQVIATTRPRS